MRKPRNQYEAIQRNQRADYKPKNPKRRQPNNKEQAALMGFYVAAKRKGGKHE
ncbi:hypothetical protein [Halothiobacillus sp.]|jgi:hypothetical protein|uniref:hypothetical protein n=1 Tax=Halothiobacillus sp. TaxID=1891311 RepID=UPI002612468D|nr:hypothetical protein [Halothiobacillus sp.]MDD4966999.1 hypothetical protein [Halothiobacillus sp.]MDY0134478.1 hypothetical protein [Atribacterota bacterium]